MPSGVAKDPSTDRRRKPQATTPEAKPPAAKRSRRTPFNAGEGRFKLSVANSPPGYHLCWFNDQKGYIERAEKGGYEFMTPTEAGEIGQDDVHSGNTDVGSKVSRVVGTTERGTELRAYLMKIKQEWHDEDMALLEQETPRSMKRYVEYLETLGWRTRMEKSSTSSNLPVEVTKWLLDYVQ